MNESKAIVLIFGALVIRECFQLFPEYGYLQPFPFNPIDISIQSYAYFAFSYIAWALLAWAFLLLMPGYEKILTAWFFLQCAEVVDYFLTYNADWFSVYGMGISITSVKFTVLAALIIHRWT